MAYKPIYEPKHFVNGEEPALNADNLNDIEKAIEKIETSLSKLTIKPLLTEGTYVGSVMDLSGEEKEIFVPSVEPGEHYNTFGFTPWVANGRYLGDFIINGVSIPLYGGSMMRNILTVDLKAGEVLTLYTSSFDDSTIEYFIDKPNLIPTVYEYDYETMIFRIGGFADDVRIQLTSMEVGDYNA